MYKRVLTLVMASILSVPFVIGCGNSEVEQEPQVKQEQVQEQPQENVQDEDLNDEYQEEVNEVELAKEILEPRLTENFGEDGYIIYTFEEKNAIVIILDLPIEALETITMSDWNELIDLMIQADELIRESLKLAGLSTKSSISVADISADTPLLGVLNGEVVYDIVNGINKLN